MFIKPQLTCTHIKTLSVQICPEHTAPPTHTYKHIQNHTVPVKTTPTIKSRPQAIVSHTAVYLKPFNTYAVSQFFTFSVKPQRKSSGRSSNPIKFNLCSEHFLQAMSQRASHTPIELLLNKPKPSRNA